MKSLLLCCFFAMVLAAAPATESFYGAGTGGVTNTWPRTRDYTTPWIDQLVADIQANPNLTGSARGDVLQVLNYLTAIAAVPSTYGAYAHQRGGSRGTILISTEPDGAVDPWHLPGSGYRVDLWLEAPSAPPPNHPPSAGISGSTSLLVGQTGSWTFGATDPDGNLTAWRFYASTNPNPQWSAVSGGTAGPGTHATSFPTPGAYTWIVEARDATGATASDSITVTVFAPPPVNRAPTATISGSTNLEVGEPGSWTFSASDVDGNLAAWRFYASTNTNPQWSGASGSTAGPGSYSTAFASPGIYTWMVEGRDDEGATGAASILVTVVAPAPTQFVLTTGATAGGGVTPGGVFPAGVTATVTATPDATHEFAGWSGDAGGTANPVGVLMNRNRAVQANFTLRHFALTTGATGGGSVTPGGSYPYGTIVTLTAVADSMSRFTGWAGDLSGTAPTSAVTMTGPRTVQAVFAPKTAQSITFAHPGDRAAGSPPFALGASASSGLPITYAVLTGPATVSGDQLQITGPGAVTVQASQNGDSYHLPAPPVTQTFNAVAAAVVKYRGSARTVLQSQTTGSPANVVLENP